MLSEEKEQQFRELSDLFKEQEAENEKLQQELVVLKTQEAEKR